MSIHGMERVAFEDYRLPKWTWNRLQVCVETGCWEWQGPPHINATRVMVMRLLNVTRDDIFAITQTCANKTCARPEHLCVVLKNKETPVLIDS